MEEIVQVINSVGFPIVACIFMYNQIQKMNHVILELSVTLKGIDTRISKIERGVVHEKENSN